MATQMRRATARTAVQYAALAMGLLFLLVGMLGAFPGITSDYEAMKFASHASGAKLLGIFQVSVLHNLIHLAFGIAGLTLTHSASGSYAYLLGGGAIYLMLWIYGIVIDHNAGGNVLALNNADNWLHLGLGLGMTLLALLLSRHDARRHICDAR